MIELGEIMKTNLLIEVDNHELAETNLTLRTLTGKEFEGKVLLNHGQSKIVVSIVELREALNKLEEFQDSMEHPLDLDDTIINNDS